MLEIKVTIESPALVDAMNNLATAMLGVNAKVITAPQSDVSVTQNKTADVKPPTTLTQPVQQAVTPVAPQVPSQPVQQPATQNTPVTPQELPQAAPQKSEAATSIQAVQQTVAPATLEAISVAGAALVDNGMMPQIMGLLNKYGVQAVTQLQPNMYEAFAADLRALGAQI